MQVVRRMRFQIYADVLWAIHSTARSQSTLSMYRIERITGLTHDRLRESLDDLHTLGFLYDGMEITTRGYAFLTDVSNKVLPVLLKYGMCNDRV